VGFIILLAGPGLPGDEIIAEQSDLILKASGVHEAIRAKIKVNSRQLTALVKEGADLQKLKDASKEMDKAYTKDELSELKKIGGGGDGVSGEAALARFLTPWFKFFLAFDPRPTLQKVKCPVLAVNGELDLQVPCTANLDAIAQALKAGGNKDVTTKAFPKLNHLFQTSTNGHPGEYGKIEETFAPVVLETIATWINQRK
jgi:pimeloyl-ACP methyl ester carboxylesterase